MSLNTYDSFNCIFFMNELDQSRTCYLSWSGGNLLAFYFTKQAISTNDRNICCLNDFAIVNTFYRGIRQVFLVLLQAKRAPTSVATPILPASKTVLIYYQLQMQELAILNRTQNQSQFNLSFLLRGPSPLPLAQIFTVVPVVGCENIVIVVHSLFHLFLRWVGAEVELSGAETLRPHLSSLNPFVDFTFLTLHRYFKPAFEIRHFCFLFSHNFLHPPDVTLVRVDEYVYFMFVFPVLPQLLVGLHQGLLRHVLIPCGCHMQLLNNMLLFHEPLNFVIEILVPTIPVALQHLNAEHVELDELGQILNKRFVFFIFTILNLDLKGQQLIREALVRIFQHIFTMISFFLQAFPFHRHGLYVFREQNYIQFCLVFIKIKFLTLPFAPLDKVNIWLGIR